MKLKLSPAALLALVCFGAVSARAIERAIEQEVTVNAPVAKVWQAWTTSEGIKTFFAPDAHVELRIDGPFEVFINPLAEPGNKGADGMRILAFQENKLLAFTWIAPPHLANVRQQRTHVVLRFAELTANQTRVTLHHDGWGEGEEWDKAFQYFSAAWPNVLANLQKSFVSGPIDWTKWMESLKKYMEQERAKSTSR